MPFITDTDFAVLRAALAAGHDALTPERNAEERAAAEGLAAAHEIVARYMPSPEPDEPIGYHSYKFKFSRTYSVTEGFERIIRAPSLPEAEAAALNLAIEFNSDCPDDCSEDESGESGADAFEAECTSAEVHKASEPDYVVLPDGQCVPYEA